MHGRSKRERKTRGKERKLTSKRRVHVYMMSVCARAKKREGGRNSIDEEKEKIIHLYYYRS